MSVTEQQYEQLYRYLNGEMTEEEQNNFKQELANHPALQEELNLHQQMDDLFLDTATEKVQYDSSFRKNYEEFANKPENKQLYKKLQEISAKTSVIGNDSETASTIKTQTEKGRTINLKWLIPVAAAILALIVFLPGIMPSKGEKLYAKYSNYDALPTITTKSGGNEFYTDIEKSFQKKEYSNLIQLFDTTTISAPSDEYDKVKLYYNLALAETGEEDKAIQNLNALATQLNYAYKDWAQYHEAIIYLKKGNKEKAINLLKKIAETNNHKKKARAEQVIKALE